MPSHSPSPSPSPENDTVTSTTTPKPPPTFVNFSISPLTPLKPITEPIGDKVALQPPPPPPPVKFTAELPTPPPPVTALSYPVNDSTIQVTGDETSPLKVQTSSSSTSIGAVIGISVGVTGAFFIVAVVIFLVCCRNKVKSAKLHDHESPRPKDDLYHVLHQSLKQQNVANGSPVSPKQVIPFRPLHCFDNNPHSNTNNLDTENQFSPKDHIVVLAVSGGNFTYEELWSATSGFSTSNLLGEGGFGYVHKGVLPTGREIAVKQLKVGSHQGEREFQAEVETISRVHHKHLVSLVGYCMTGMKRLLVYEFVANRTLEYHLHGAAQTFMEWSARIKIAIGSAKGLAYLHEDCVPRSKVDIKWPGCFLTMLNTSREETFISMLVDCDKLGSLMVFIVITCSPEKHVLGSANGFQKAIIILDLSKISHEYASGNPTIIHRDIKAANILLDSNFEAKVADFGLAKFLSDSSHHVSHVSTRVVGTFGYLAPEYAQSGKASDKSDIFSFGVMLLELITGRPPIISTESSACSSLVIWARPLLRRALEDGKFDTLVDPCLGQNYNSEEMANMVACAAACVRHSSWRRPRMSQVLRALEGDASILDLDEENRPGESTFCDFDSDGRNFFENLKQIQHSTLKSKEEMVIPAHIIQPCTKAFMALSQLKME